MAFCRTCGKEIHDNAVVCVHCGCQTNIKSDDDNDKQASLLECFLSWLVPLAGFIYGIYYINKKPKAAKGCLTAAILGFIGNLFVISMYI